jgi:hypothetical protein
MIPPTLIIYCPLCDRPYEIDIWEDLDRDNKCSFLCKCGVMLNTMADVEVVGEARITRDPTRPWPTHPWFAKWQEEVEEHEETDEYKEEL